MAINPANHTPDLDPSTSTEVKTLLDNCKSLARQAKSEVHNNWIINPTFRDSVPPRKICDRLVNQYLRTSEGVYRILHVPSFRKEYENYWEKPAAASPVVIFKMLLVMSIGSGFYQGPDSERYRTEARKWIFAVQAWLASPLEKGRLHMSAVQIHCLLLIARQSNAISDDLVYISAGALLRVAFTMGYHRDPEYLPKMSVLQAEMRRRLWATIVELNVQFSLDSGQALLLSTDDYDTVPPLNLNDADITETTSVAPTPKPASTYTDQSLQLLLMTTLPIRMKITHEINGLKPLPNYDFYLSLSAALLRSCKENSTFISKANKNRPTPLISQFHQNLLDLAIRRFLLIMHRPFNAKADSEPRYYFSRKICIDSAMIMLTYPLSPPNPSHPEDMDDYSRLLIIGGGFFKTVVIHCTMMIFNELLRSLEEDSLPSEMAKATRGPLKKVCLLLRFDSNSGILSSYLVNLYIILPRLKFM